MLDRARANDKIEFVTNAVIEEILGDGKVESVRLRDTTTGDTWETKVDGVFVAIGPLVAHPRHDDEPRPTLRSHGHYVFGIFLLARAVPDEDSIYYQEIGVVLTHDTMLTVRKTPADGGEPYDIASVRAAVRDTD